MSNKLWLTEIASGLTNTEILLPEVEARDIAYITVSYILHVSQSYSNETIVPRICSNTIGSTRGFKRS
jgi:hypothetical protein